MDCLAPERTATAASAQPAAPSCIQLQVDNPHSGDPLSAGKYEVSGRATDSAAQSGSGIDRIQAFLDSRDLGGSQIGETTQTQATGRFSLVVDFPSDSPGNHTLVVYARSAASATELTASVPINIGATPVGTVGTVAGGQPPTIATSPQCAPSVQTNTSDPLSSSTTATSPAPDETITVVLDAPHPGATLTPGKYEVSGRATSTVGAIDRVQIFLDNRDLGGVGLGDAMLNGNRFRLVVDFPPQPGLHTVFVYARSATTQKEGIATTGILLSGRS
jgi:hypothetical protein